ncbi:g7307 [Coccomyxa viridis]|uniref:G7307 protein n=1 Tax=Coccomyxa viridis TaxID=1274662 RepID=A0ABP1FXI7_9CHLO
MGLMNWFIHRIIDQIFNQVDYNNNGRLEPVEIEIAILKVYNIINKRLPGWQNPPTRKQIQTALTVFDVDGNGTLDKWEFYEFTKSMTSSGPDTFFKRVGTSAVIRTAFIPGVTHLLQRAARESGQFGKFGNAPLAIMAPALGVVGGALRGLLPGI